MDIPFSNFSDKSQIFHKIFFGGQWERIFLKLLLTETVPENIIQSVLSVFWKQNNNNKKQKPTHSRKYLDTGAKIEWLNNLLCIYDYGTPCKEQLMPNM